MKITSHCVGTLVAALTVVTLVVLSPSRLVADGVLKRLVNYEASLEERSQEAIIIFESVRGSGREDLILKITVEGEADQFAWVIPFPDQPETKPADARLFKELFTYVEYRLPRTELSKTRKLGGMGGGGFAEDVDVLSREIVGTYDVAVVRENTAGTLNQWLDDQGYRRIENSEQIIDFYRTRGYVFTCIKVSEAKLTPTNPVDLHPLRFTFKTGGRDGIYFPVKMTGLQKEPFDINLYVFSPMPLNDRLNQYGYEYRGFRHKYRDPPHPAPTAAVGRNWSQPDRDHALRPWSHLIRTTAELFQQTHPGRTYCLTNIQAFQLEPTEVRDWAGDLWLFPYYRKSRFIPYDARPTGPAFAAYAP